VAFGWPADAAAAEGVIAFVSGHDTDKDELLAIAKAGLPAYVVPRELIIVPEMPLNANGKVDRRALKERLVAQHASV
jgi:acyl-CoA synthetase (AMP-forming)/AMP-acid ligase II